MFLRELGQPVSVLRGAGPAVTERLARLGVLTIADLLLRYPRDYEDRSVFLPFSSVGAEGRVHTIATVLRHEWFGFGRMRTLKLVVEDGTGEAALPCFNRAFLADRHPEGSRVLVVGQFKRRYGELQSSAFELEALGEGEHRAGGLLPVYALTEGLKLGSLRNLVGRALAEYGARVEDELPAALVEEKGLLHKREALRAIHHPRNLAELEAARRTLVYEELFYFQLAVARRALSRRACELPRVPVEGRLRRRLLERLPFALTPDQEKAVAEIVADLRAPHPMGRLLQGDVGSGKTLVAFLACLEVVEGGGQAAIMAPTELLARQHAQSAARLLEPLGIRLAFLSGNVEDAARPPLLAALAKGEVDLVIGTQALFSDSVAFKNLRLAVVDEQHRFGVLQRLALTRKGPMPDLLMMTATPIPRTLALTVFGDLSVSVIKTMPEGRKPIVTHLAKQGNEARVYEFARRELAAGRRAYFVYPLVGDGEGPSERSAGLKNAEAMYERLAREVFPDHGVGLVHSRKKEEEKRATMEAFAAGQLSVLVATSVVEVGVDVPEATIMVVEHAERFGLAALHQLRGRVGRGRDQSWCFLVYGESLTEDAKARLKAMLESSDGFFLAEQDLRIRGPGELAGTSQSGYLKLTIADPVRDAAVLEEARRDAFAVAEADPALLSAANARLREVLERASPFTEKAGATA